MSREPLRIFISACEPSGDMLGAELITALIKVGPPDIEFYGLGGSAMTARGFHSMVSTDDLAVMGLGDVVPALRRAHKITRQAMECIDRVKPDMLITIDSMGFHRQLVTRIRRRHPRLKTIHHGAPKYWAWWPGRAKRIRGLFDNILCLFPFEPEFFASHDLPCEFVGHPVVNRMACETADIENLKERLAISDEAPVLLLLPGSRPAEVKRLLPVFAQTVTQVRQTLPNLIVLMPTLPLVADQVNSFRRNWDDRVHVVEGEGAKAAAFHLGDVALAASGTVSLELAACGLPQITAYKVGPISAWIARKLIRTEYVNLVNILSDTPVVPEYLQENCRPEALSASVIDLLTNPKKRAHQKQAYKQVLSDLGGEGAPPAERAAKSIMQHFPGSAH